MAKRRRRTSHEIFLSHAGRDRRRADRIAETLRRHGLSVWYSRTHIIGARQWHDEIGAALEHCNWFVLLLTPNSVKSKWVKRELLYVLSEDRYENRIVPILFQDCDIKKLSWTLPAFQYIDFEHGFDTGCEELLRIWKINYLAE